MIAQPLPDVLRDVNKSHIYDVHIHERAFAADGDMSIWSTVSQYYTCKEKDRQQYGLSICNRQPYCGTRPDNESEVGTMLILLYSIDVDI